MIKITNYLKQHLAGRQSIGLLVFAVVAIIITLATVDQIEFNYRLESQARQLEQEVEVLKQQATNQELNNRFLSTDSFLKLEAGKLGLVEAGASLLILDADLIKATAANYRPPQPVVADSSQPAKLEQWVRFFSGRRPL